MGALEILFIIIIIISYRPSTSLIGLLLMSYKRIFCCWLLLYVLFSALKETHCALISCDFEWMTVAFYSMLSNCHQNGVLKRYFVVTWCMLRETAAISVHILPMPYNHATECIGPWKECLPWVFILLIILVIPGTGKGRGSDAGLHRQSARG